MLKFRKFVVPLTLLFVFVFSACDKEILVNHPETSQTANNAYTTEQDAIIAVNSAYDPLQWQFVPELGDAYAFTWMYQGLRSGDFRQDAGGSFSAAADLENFNVTPGNLFVKTVWFKLFSGVYRANEAITKIENMPDEVFSENNKQRVIGEAKFLRALYYFELVRNWGGVPLFTESVGVDNLKVPRSSTEDVYAQIEKDLLSAAQALPDSYGPSNKGRATSLAANGLLAKVYLYQEKFGEAKSAAEKVIAFEGDLVDLEENFGDNWDLSNEYGIESLFEVGYMENSAGSSFSTQNDGSLSAQFTLPWIAYPMQGWSYNLPKPILFNAFESGDERLDATIIHEGSTFDSQMMEDWSWSPVTKEKLDELTLPDNMLSKKFFLPPEDLAELSTIQKSPLNRKVLRYSDVLLIHAEACLFAGGDGLASINKVRERAGLDPLSSYDLDDIVQERWVELANEGQRFYDLVRWELASTVLESNGFTSGRDELLPIPFDEIVTAGKKDGENVLKQNPGYN